MITLINLIVLLSACGSLSKAREENLQRIRVGQSADELISILGEPQQREKIGSTEKWYYAVSSRNGYRTYPYTATIADGRLKTFDFDTNRGREDNELREQREKAMKDAWLPGPAGPDGSAPLKP